MAGLCVGVKVSGCPARGESCILLSVRSEGKLGAERAGAEAGAEAGAGAVSEAKGGKSEPATDPGARFVAEFPRCKGSVLSRKHSVLNIPASAHGAHIA